MMNLTSHPSQDNINAMFYSAKELNEDMYVGDVVIDDEGKCITSVIKADGTVETKTLDKELQMNFEKLILSSVSKVEAVVKMKQAKEEVTADE